MLRELGFSLPTEQAKGGGSRVSKVRGEQFSEGCGERLAGASGDEIEFGDVVLLDGDVSSGDGVCAVCERWSRLRDEPAALGEPEAELSQSRGSKEAEDGGEHAGVREGAWLSLAELCAGDVEGCSGLDAWCTQVCDNPVSQCGPECDGVDSLQRSVSTQHLGDSIEMESDADEVASVRSWHTASEGRAEDAGDEVVWSFDTLVAKMKELDEAQLRLSSFAEEQLALWLKGGADEPGQLGVEDSTLQIQDAWDRVDCIQAELKALAAVEVQEPSLEFGEDGPGEVVLHTRSVSLPEVLANWEVWEEPAKCEVEALVQEKRALVPVDWAQINKWKFLGKHVIIIPSKCVWTVKAPTGRRKCRLVACGNMTPHKHESKSCYKESVYASSLDITHLRMALAWATRRGLDIAITDIRTAFLNAMLLPRNRAQAEQVASNPSKEEDFAGDTGEEIVILMPPRCLFQRNVVPKWMLWRVCKAIYGLDTSPRDWSLSRDHSLRTLQLHHEDQELYLFQSFAEPNLWLIAAEEPERGWSTSGIGLDKLESSGVKVLGWLAVYIDDLMIAGARALVMTALNAIMTLWKCGEPEWVGYDLEKPLRFLGLELAWSRHRSLLLWQGSYVRELGTRYVDELANVSTPDVPLGTGLGERSTWKPLGSAKSLLGKCCGLAYGLGLT